MGARHRVLRCAGALVESCDERKAAGWL